MKVLTYSQGLLIDDPFLLSTLSVFCERVWLPETRTAEAVADSVEKEIAQSGPWELGEAISRGIRSDNTPEKIEQWEQQYRQLFENGALKRLPRSSATLGQQHAHRHDFDDESIEEVLGTEKPIYERLALRYHLMRADLPGIELFDSSEAKERAELARAVFYLDLPKLNADPDRIWELREAAQRADIAQFWDMIEEQSAYGQSEGKPALVRAEKIRTEFKKWKDDFSKFRGALAGTGLLITLCWFSSVFAPLATFSAAMWLGDVNRWWVARQEREHRAFKFIARIDRKLSRI
jgi:hypothetical protein